MKTIKSALAFSCIFISSTTLAITAAIPALAGHSKNTISIIKPVDTDADEYSDLKGLNKKILHVALKAYNYALKESPVKRKMMAIADYTQSSVEKRFYIVDIEHKKVVGKYRVAHGSRSGALYAYTFSNDIGSHMTSLGVFLTEGTYYGKYGYALRLRGLEANINDNAQKRDVIVHGEWFLKPSVVHSHHEAGKSYGCFVVDPAKAKQVINYIKDGAVLFSYSPKEDKDPHFN